MVESGNFWITIVTIVYNNEDTIEQTIVSVLNQTSKEKIEYIVIDGASSDGTTEKILTYKDQIILHSEPDNGIYDAMNKGIELATGDWILFMNCGDRFIDNSVIEKVFSKDIPYETKIIYGDHYIERPHGLQFKKAGTPNKLWMGSQWCHQSTFIRTEYQKKKIYNVESRIIADYEFLYQTYVAGGLFYYLDFPVSIFKPGGVSDVQRITSIIGRWRVKPRNLLQFPYYVLLILLEIVKKPFKSTIKKYYGYHQE